MKLNINDTFNKALPADPIKQNTRRQVTEACFSYVTPRMPGDAKLLHHSPDMLKTIGLKPDDVDTDIFQNMFSGGLVLEGTNPYAMCYGGHQFGHWAGQLGDGRAINLCEVEHQNKRWALQLKGAGATPYSRSADGLAVLRSSVREHLCSEAMYHLGVPTTRSLSLMTTGDKVLRDVLYDGNPAYEKGAVVCRVAPSFIRFGSFQIFAARRDHKTLQKLVDYTIKYFYPHIIGDDKDRYLQFYKEVTERTLDMIIHWQRVGFVHGVMNTDNMSILGLTIDYGPYGWLEGYEPGWTPNTTDAQGKRYRFGQQGQIALWNLVQLGNALFPLVDDAPKMEHILHNFQGQYLIKYNRMMLDKLGLYGGSDESKDLLVEELESVLQLTETDMTIFFRNLAELSSSDRIVDGFDLIQDAFYTPDDIEDATKDKWSKWLQTYVDRLKAEKVSENERKTRMNKVNPKYVLRNYMAQLAIDKADEGDYALIAELYDVLRNPYAEQPEYQKWYAKRPEWARHKVGCSMLSCSS